MDEGLLDRLKTYARSQGKSLNLYVNEVLERAVPEDQTQALDNFFKLGDQMNVDLSKVKRWTREEIYDR